MNDEQAREQARALAQSAEEHLAALYAVIDDNNTTDDERDEAQEEEANLDYGYTVSRVVRITLAGGGPSHILEIIVDSDGDLESVTSLTSWAGPTDRTEHNPDSALWRYAEHYAEITEA